MRIRNLFTGVSIAAAALLPVHGAEACTGIALETASGGLVSARTIEWGNFNLNSKLIQSGRGHSFTSALPMEKQGLTWENKYGFVGIPVSDDRFIGEGMNEAGLNAGLFYFAGYGELAAFDPDDTANNVADMDLVRWMLGQFATAEEVKASFDRIKVVPIFINEAGLPSPTAHWRVTDKAGGSIVIEIMDGRTVHIHYNDVGVLTNSPDFPWMVKNLNTYINVAPGTVAPRTSGARQLSSFGAGTASFGLPGDISPPSRFVRAAFYRNTVPPLTTTEEAVSQAFHILDNLDIPICIEFSDDQREFMPDLPSATQWTAASDLSSGLFYYRKMYDSTIKRVDLGRMDFGSPSETAHPLYEGRFSFEDVTS